MASTKIIGRTAIEDTSRKVEPDRVVSFALDGNLTRLPDYYRVGRNAQLQMTQAEKSIYDKASSGDSYTIQIPEQLRKEKKVTELDLASFNFAVAQLLYNQSYACGNLNTNSGAEKKLATEVSRRANSEIFRGTVFTTLAEITRLAYGEENPSFRQKQAMHETIEVIAKSDVVTTAPDGQPFTAPLCARFKHGGNIGKSIQYKLILNPIYCSDTHRNYGELPQDILKRLSSCTKKKTAAHLWMIRLLSIQDKRKPFTRTREELLKELDLTASYKKNKARTETLLISIFDSTKAIGMVNSYTIIKEGTKGRERISKVIFDLNKSFTRPEKMIEADETNEAK